MQIKITEIKIGERLREVNDDKVRELAESIQQLGLLQPVLVDKDYTLIAGAHRVAAYKLLELPVIEVSVFTHKGLLAELAEIDENLIRNELPELDEGNQLIRRKDIYEELYPETKHGAKKSSQNKDPDSGSLPEKESYADNTAKATGKSKSKVSEQITTAKNIPKKLQDKIKGTALADQATNLKDIAKLHKDLKLQEKFVDDLLAGKVKNITEFKTQEKKAERARKTEAKKAEYENRKETASSSIDIDSTDKKYRVIYADPAWSYNDTCENGGVQSGGASKHYDVMSIKQISDLPVKDITEKDAVLFLWVTSPLLEECFDVIKAWGFKYKSSFIWDKIAHNMGHYNSVRHELLLICTKGSCTPDNKKLYDSVQSIERKEHSKKPVEFVEIINDLYSYGDKLEMFCRDKKDGWDAWGNEV